MGLSNLRIFDGTQWVPKVDLPGARVIVAIGGNSSSPEGPAMSAQIATSTSLKSSASTVNAGTNITLTATVKGANAGTVQFQRNSGAGGAWSTISSGAVNSSGVRTYTVAVNSTYSYRAVYVGTSAFGASSSSAVAVTAKTLRTASKTLGASWSAAYQEDGDIRSGVGEVYQGYYSSTNGNQRSYIGFPALGLPAGAQITKIEVYLYAKHWYQNSGGTVCIGWHNRSSKPSSVSGSGETQDYQRTTWTSKTGGKWITLNSIVNNYFENGTYKGIVVGKAPSNSSAYYGYFAGSGQSYEPQLRVTYQYWA